MVLLLLLLSLSPGSGLPMMTGGRSLGRLAIRRTVVGPDWALDPRAGLVLVGARLGGLSGVTGGYQWD